jgi:amidase
LAPSLDTCGWFTRDIHSFIRVGEVLLGPDSAPLPAAGFGRVRLLRPADAWALVAPEVQEALAPGCAAAQALCGAATAVDVVLESFDAMYWHLRHIQGREAWVTHGALITRFAPPMGPGVAERFAWSSRVSDEQVAAALAFRSAFRRHLSDLLGDDGVLLLPTMPDIAPLAAAPEHTLEDYRNRAIRLLCIAGLSGFPQLSLPGATRLGAPLGLSLLGPAGSDRSLLGVARDIAAPGPH